MKYLNVDNRQDLSQVYHLMDSNSKTVFLIGSLDENFGKAICAKLGPLVKSYPMKVLGMPTWERSVISMLRPLRIWKYIIPLHFI